MFIFIALIFLAGDIFLQQFNQLPTVNFIVLCGVLNLLIALILRIFLPKPINKYAYLPLIFFLGFIYTDWYAQNQLKTSFPKTLEAKPIYIIGYITSLPNTENGISHFFFTVTKIKKENIYSFHGLIKLSWRNNECPIKVGDKWQFKVRLKRIHGMQNPDTFDFEAWALQKGIRANGYVITSVDNKLLTHSPYRFLVNKIRQTLHEKIMAHLPVSTTSPWLEALIIGERNGIPAKDWQVLRNTGTNHLMAVGGLHIGFMAGFIRIIVEWMWRQIPKLLLIFPAQQVGRGAALIGAFLYSLLAGWSLPTQRACIMLSVFILMYLIKRKINVWSNLGWALLVVLFFNPLSVLTESFWLSFCTIALIIYGLGGRLQVDTFWWKWGRVQWVIALGLLPLTVVLFQECSLVSFVANSIAIPWLGFFILPFCFLSSVCLFILPSLAGGLLYIADRSLSCLWIILNGLASNHFAVWHVSHPPLIIFIVIISGCLLLLSPKGFPGKWRGLFWLMPFIFFRPSLPAVGNFWVSVLDVGQGLAVVIQTHNHIMVYDTGAKWGDYDMGRNIVIPYLYHIGARRLDMLMISHGDNDHIGGAAAIEEVFKPKIIKSSVPELLPKYATSCLAGEQWTWDGIKISVLYPNLNDLGLNNDSSCVLRIENNNHAVLLTGDIEKYAERKLLLNAKEKLPAEILIAPHHGSKTSGLIDFVRIVNPRVVVYSTGYLNRYHHPHHQIIELYNVLQVRQFNTVNTGSILFKIGEDSLFTTISYRGENSHYWHAAFPSTP